jgi:8-oxo-dGTP pyrophosphatase MutT (NUDIX family)
MTRIIIGDRVGREGKIRVGCSAVIFDAKRKKVLLTKREDNAQWCLPSGGMEPGESASEACIREVLEETGLKIEVVRLIGIYTTPSELIEYQDGTRVQLVALHFEGKVLEGELSLSDETTDYNYFSFEQINNLDLMINHKQRIIDTFSEKRTTFIR